MNEFWVGIIGALLVSVPAAITAMATARKYRSEGHQAVIESAITLVEPLNKRIDELEQDIAEQRSISRQLAAELEIERTQRETLGRQLAQTQRELGLARDRIRTLEQENRKLRTQLERRKGRNDAE